MALDGHVYEPECGLGIIIPRCSCGKWRGTSTPDDREAADQFEGHLRSMRTRAEGRAA